jgi:hypothetical protein
VIFCAKVSLLSLNCIEANDNIMFKFIPDCLHFQLMIHEVSVTPRHIHIPVRFPSLAIPTPYLKKSGVKTEDDLLHLPNLPNFDSTLPGSDVEVLLSILTVPYLRIPMILSFFATEERIHSLRSEVGFHFLFFSFSCSITWGLTSFFNFSIFQFLLEEFHKKLKAIFLKC